MDERLLREYRLGRLERAQREEIENRAFEDDDIDARVEAAGFDLLDDYARGALSPEDRAAVEARFSPGQIAAAEALRGRTGATVRRARSWPRWAMAAGLALCLVPAAYYYSRETRPPATVGVPKARPVTVEFALRTPVRRGAPAPVLRVPRIAEAVVFRIAAEPGYSSYDMEVRSAQRGRVVVRSGVSGTQLVEVEVPVNLLPAGDYDFLLSGSKSGGPPSLLATYACRVERE